jgi:hypothetical protein
VPPGASNEGGAEPDPRGITTGFRKVARMPPGGNSMHRVRHGPVYARTRSVHTALVRDEEEGVVLFSGQGR